MRVKATDKFSYYRLLVLEGLTVDDFRSLQRGEVVDITKELYESNKHIFEVVKMKSTLKGVKDGD